MKEQENKQGENVVEEVAVVRNLPWYFRAGEIVGGVAAIAHAKDWASALVGSAFFVHGIVGDEAFYAIFGPQKEP